MNPPIVYSYRRCPYCIRAHMAIHASQVPVEVREVKIRGLPPDAQAVSPNNTVPVLVISPGIGLCESWEIMRWALQQHDPENWLGNNANLVPRAEALVRIHDGAFKANLDRYKYPTRLQDAKTPSDPLHARDECARFLAELNQKLSANPFLLGESLSIADVAIFPFIRQFAMVDQDWFDHAPFPALQAWLNTLLTSPHFHAAFQKRPLWQESPSAHPYKH